MRELISDLPRTVSLSIGDKSMMDVNERENTRGELDNRGVSLPIVFLGYTM